MLKNMGPQMKQQKQAEAAAKRAAAAAEPEGLRINSGPIGSCRAPRPRPPRSPTRFAILRWQGGPRGQVRA